MAACWKWSFWSLLSFQSQGKDSGDGDSANWHSCDRITQHLERDIDLLDVGLRQSPESDHFSKSFQGQSHITKSSVFDPHGFEE
jgi:hypothetical protein